MKCSLFSLALILIGLACTSPEAAVAQDAQTKAALNKTLQSFAEQHSVTRTALLETLGKIVLDEQKLVKGGIGVIGHDTFIMLREKQNALLLDGRKWTGKHATEQQVVLIEGNNVLGDVHSADLSKVTIVLFSPNEVRFINLATSIAGRYERKLLAGSNGSE